MSEGNVRFARIRGRIVPIRQAQGRIAKGEKPTSVVFKVKKRSAGERFKSGFKGVGGFMAKVGGVFGGVAGGIAGAAEGGKRAGRKGAIAGGIAGAVAGGAVTAGAAGLQWGVVGGAANAAFGSRYKSKVVGVRFGGKKRGTQ